MMRRSSVFKLIRLSLMCIVFAVFFCADMALAQYTEVPVGYTGIYTIGDLAGINNDVNGNYILMNDIDLTEATSDGGSWDTGHGWPRLSTFYGTLDGNGYRIIGLRSIIDEDQASGALFSGISGGTVKNLSLVDFDITVTYDTYQGLWVGCLAGYLSNRGKIENVTVHGTITLDITDSNHGSIGGIVGELNPSCTITNCISNVNYVVRNDEVSYICGVAGRPQFGGEGSAKYCYNIGTVESGLHNGLYYPISTSSSYCYYVNGWADQVATSNAKPLTEAQMKIANCYTSFDFTDTWYIDPYCQYPYAQLKAVPTVRITDLELRNLPDQTAYEAGDALNLEGAILHVVYEDGSDVDLNLTEKMLSSYDMTEVGTQSIKVTWDYTDISFDIEIHEKPVTDISFESGTLSIYRGDSYTPEVEVIPADATNKTLVWESSNTAVATVSQKGKITAKNKGEAVITATTANGLSASITVTVRIPCVEIIPDDEEIYVCPGMIFDIGYTISPLNCNDEIRVGSSYYILELWAPNQWLATGEGTSILTYTAGSGATATTTVHVEHSEKLYGKKAATYFSAGYTGDAKCRRCGEFIKSGKSIPKLVLSKPASLKLTAYSKAMTVSFSKAKGSTGTQIQYSRYKSMSKAQSVMTTRKSFKIKSLASKKNYYVRIRAYKTSGSKTVYSKWSKIKSIKVQ